MKNIYKHRRERPMCRSVLFCIIFMFFLTPSVTASRDTSLKEGGLKMKNIYNTVGNDLCVVPFYFVLFFHIKALQLWALCLYR